MAMTEFHPRRRRMVDIGQLIREIEDVGVLLAQVSYFQAIRTAASASLDNPVGRVVPLTSQDDEVRITQAAERRLRPWAIARRELDGAEFALLIDTEKR